MTASTAAAGAACLKLHNVIDSTKFTEGKTYKISVKMRLTDYSVVTSFDANGTTKYKAYRAGDTAVTDDSGNVIVPTAEQIKTAANNQLKLPTVFLMSDATKVNSANVNGTAITKAGQLVANDEWTTIELPQFKATADMGTTTNIKYNNQGPYDILQYSVLRCNQNPVTVTVDGTKYTVIPSQIDVDDVLVSECTQVREDVTNGTYTKTYDGSSKTDITGCGDGANTPAVVTDFGHSGDTSIKQTIKTTKEYLGAGIRVQNLFGDLPPVNEDIGKVFEISAWVYAEKTENIPEDSTGTYFEMAMAAPYAASNAWTSKYKSAIYYVPWNEWTQIKIYHKVAEDYSMDNNDADGKGNNGRCDAVRIQSADCTLDGNVVNTFYIDDVAVREIETDVETAKRPRVSQTLCKSEDGREDAIYSKIVVTPGNNVKISKMYAYMLPTSLITNNVKNELAKTDKNIVSLPKVNGEGTVTIFSVLTGIPATDIDITSKVAFTCDAPYLYGEQSAGTYYDTVNSTVAELLNK